MENTITNQELTFNTFIQSFLEMAKENLSDYMQLTHYTNSDMLLDMSNHFNDIYYFSKINDINQQIIKDYYICQEYEATEVRFYVIKNILKHLLKNK